MQIKVSSVRVCIRVENAQRREGYSDRDIGRNGGNEGKWGGEEAREGAREGGKSTSYILQLAAAPLVWLPSADTTAAREPHQTLGGGNKDEAACVRAK